MPENKFAVGKWTKATFWGWLLGVVFIIALSSFLDSIGIENMQFYLGVGMGAGVGFTQWLYLKKNTVVQSKNWIWLSILGMGIPFLILDLVVKANPVYKIMMGISYGALALGILQHSFIRNFFSKSRIWIYGCFSGWFLAAITVNSINYTMKFSNLFSPLVLAILNLFLILASGIVLGVITGITMKKIIYKSIE